MTEEELKKKREEYREQELQGKIANYSSASEYREQTLKSNYTYKKVNKNVGKIGKTLIISQSIFLIFFSLLFVFSYIPATKFIVTKVMP